MTKILAKMQKLMEAVTYIQKDKENTFHRYRYASEASIKAAVQPKMAELGIIFKMEAEPGAGYEIIDTGNTDKNGKVIKIMVLWMRYSFTDAESGEAVTGLMPGTGDAGDDKCVYKAITGAIKYALSSNLLFATGDDAEDDGQKGQQPQAQTRKINMSDVKPKTSPGGGVPQPPHSAATTSHAPSSGLTPEAEARKEAGRKMWAIVTDMGLKGPRVPTLGQAEPASTISLDVDLVPVVRNLLGTKVVDPVVGNGPPFVVVDTMTLDDIVALTEVLTQVRKRRTVSDVAHAK